jgi:uncharacterized membrane protein YGL010W
MVKNPALQALFVDYLENHRHPMNRLTHKVAIPLIVLHIIAMLDWVVLPVPPVAGLPVTLAHVGFLLAAVWYLRMDVKLGALVLLGMAACLPLGRALPTGAVVAIAAVGWLVQLAGHTVWEKKQPSFVTNLVHALVGPVFFVALLTGDFRVDAPAARGATAS